MTLFLLLAGLGSVHGARWAAAQAETDPAKAQQTTAQQTEAQQTKSEQTKALQEWHTGSGFMHRVRNGSFGVTWREAPLRQELEVLSRSVGLAVFVDRRVDPTRTVTLQRKGLRYEEFLWQVAEPASAAVIRIEPLFYLGPPTTAAALPQRLEEFRKQIQAAGVPDLRRRALLEPIRIVEPHPFEPGLMLADRMRGSGIVVTGWELLPHDFWGPIDLPEMPRYQALTLLLAGFDLQPVLAPDGSLAIRKAEVPTQLSIRIEREDLRGPRPDWKASGKVEVKSDSRGVLLRGPAEELCALLRQVSRGESGSSGKAAGNDSRLTLNTRASRGDILATVASQLGRKLVFDQAIRPLLEERIELTVTDAEAETVITRALDGTRLRFLITDDELKIEPGEKQ